MCKAGGSWRCQCGHIAEWHYKVGTQGQLVTRDPCGGDGFLPGKVRCPDPTCDCTAVTEPVAAH